MRISTQTLFESGAARLGEVQSGLLKIQQQVASGRRILTPSDDPVGAARALEVTQSQSINTQHGVNRQHAKSALVSVEGALESATSLLLDVKTSIVTASNGSLTDSQRGFLATELRSRFDALLSIANSRDGMGNYQFSGYQTVTPPFAETATGAQYQGDQGQRLLQVDATRQMAISNPGQAVFQGGGQDIFNTLKDLITLLQTPVGSPAAAAALSSGLALAGSNTDLALDNVLTVRASVGTRLQEIEALDFAGDDRNLQYSQTLSELQDVDYTQALTQLSQQQFIFEAAQRSFVTVSGLSLFNFL
ncbi:MAG: flagellar hook-associated protein FlgL [Thiobacillus sp.]|nr:flagellar hook-associated protein FlgL [Thiobacillus sp.]